MRIAHCNYVFHRNSNYLEKESLLQHFVQRHITLKKVNWLKIISCRVDLSLATWVVQERKNHFLEDGRLIVPPK